MECVLKLQRFIYRRITEEWCWCQAAEGVTMMSSNVLSSCFLLSLKRTLAPEAYDVMRLDQQVYSIKTTLVGMKINGCTIKMSTCRFCFLLVFFFSPGSDILSLAFSRYHLFMDFYFSRALSCSPLSLGFFLCFVKLLFVRFQPSPGPQLHSWHILSFQWEKEA